MCVRLSRLSFYGQQSGNLYPFAAMFNIMHKYTTTRKKKVGGSEGVSVVLGGGCGGSGGLCVRVDRMKDKPLSTCPANSLQLIWEYFFYRTGRLECILLL